MRIIVLSVLSLLIIACEMSNPDGEQLTDTGTTGIADAGVAPAVELYPTPGAVDPIRLMIPATVIAASPTFGYYPVGEIDGVFWFSYADQDPISASEDRFDINGKRYLVSQNGNRNLFTHDFMAIRED